MPMGADDARAGDDGHVPGLPLEHLLPLAVTLAVATPSAVVALLWLPRLAVLSIVLAPGAAIYVAGRRHLRGERQRRARLGHLEVGQSPWVLRGTLLFCAYVGLLVAAAFALLPPEAALTGGGVALLGSIAALVAGRRGNARRLGRAAAYAAAPPDLPEVWDTYADRIPADRVGLARQLEECEDFRVVDAEYGMVFVFLYDDARWLVGDGAIEALADSLANLDGVDDMQWPNREIIEVFGSITPAQLEAWLIAELASTGDPHYWDDRAIEL